MDNDGEDDEESERRKEDLCRRCGICCHEKIRVGDRVIITDIPCKYLDAETNLCRVYNDRAKRESRCLGADAAVKANAMPGDCPYVAGVADYLDPWLLREHPEFEELVDSLYPERKNPAPGKGDSQPEGVSDP